MKAVVVLSGGQDSATCLALAIRKHGAENVAAITFAYGQRHAIETKFAKRLTKLVPEAVGNFSHATGMSRLLYSSAERRRDIPVACQKDDLRLQRGRDIPVACQNNDLCLQRGRDIPVAYCKKAILHKIVHLDFYRHLTTNALLDPTMNISQAGEDKRQETRDKTPLSTSTSSLHLSPPNTVVEGRNAIFLQLAAVWAKTLGATEVYTGVSEADYSGYPDCRAAFIRAEEKAIRLALDYPIRIVTPFMHMSKAEEWALAAKLGIFDVIRNETVTCYNGIPGDGCGKCPACKLRSRGLKEYLKKAKGQGEGEVRRSRSPSGCATKETRHSCRVSERQPPPSKGTRHSCRVSERQPPPPKGTRHSCRVSEKRLPPPKGTRHSCRVRKEK